MIGVYFHSEHRQLPWCRELWPAPRVEINPRDAADLGIAQPQGHGFPNGEFSSVALYTFTW